MNFTTNPQSLDDNEKLITKIEPQKKKQNRFSIFINGEYAFGVSDNTYNIFNLRKGQSLSEKQIQTILFHEEFEKGKELALKYIGLRMRSVKEIKRYLSKKGLSELTTDRVIQYCKDNKYLDDTEFARTFTRDKINLNKIGRFKIYSMLKEKGISNQTIEEVFEKLIDDDEQIKIATELGEKKLKTIGQKEKTREKIYRYLHQKGFSNYVIMEAIRKLSI
jgi:regulatory protein